MNVRAAAARVLCAVKLGASLSDALPPMLQKYSNIRDQAFLQALCYGVCRWYFRLDAVLKELLSKPLKSKDEDVHSLLLVGLYQLSDMRVPAHAAIAETVSATRSLKKIWAKGLLNAVLREYQRSEVLLNEKIAQTDLLAFSHPAWMIEKIKKDWPNHWRTILTANNTHPPLALRVNQKKITRENYLKKLAEKKISASQIIETHSGIALKAPIDVHQLPGFSAGWVYVQDGAAQLAAEIVSPVAGERILDACAAPGGKTTHLLEQVPQLEKLIALDNDEARLNLLRENLQRLELNADVLCADALNPKLWWDGKLFDRILLDAPCSASGVIRRHPDIKLLRQPQDIQRLAAVQQQLIAALWPLLKPGGMLTYVTCSVFQQENNQVLELFLAQTPTAEEIKIKANWGQACAIGRQILPGEHDMDGFYFACLRKCIP